MQFGNIPIENLYRLFQDGRFSSEPLAWTFESAFDDLIYVDQKGYDFEHPFLGKIEQKQITKQGLKFCPSNMIGQGRKVDQQLVRQHIAQLDLHFLIPSIVEFPIVHVVLLPGLILLDECTTSSCSFSRTDAINKLINPYAIES